MSGTDPFSAETAIRHTKSMPMSAVIHTLEKLVWHP